MKSRHFGMRKKRRCWCISYADQVHRRDDPIEPVDIRQAIGLSLDLTRAICESRAKVSTEWEDVPCVLAHHGRLVQVFTNLLTNAAEAIDDGSPKDNEIAVSARSVGPNTVEVEFRDTGRGIPQENLQHIFDPFFTTKTQGTGLDLTICQRIISSFNGEIRFEQAPPRGSASAPRTWAWPSARRGCGRCSRRWRQRRAGRHR